MLSTLIKTTKSNPYLLHDDVQTPNTLVHISYEQNNYQALVEQLKNGKNYGWILFLAPPGKPSTSFFQQIGIDKSRVLMIDSSKVENNLEMLSTLLRSDNYCTVVTWTNELSKKMQSKIETDAKLTNTKCFIYCKQ